MSTIKMLCIEGRVALAAFTSFAVLSLYQIKILFGDYWSYKYSAVACISALCCIFILPYTDILKRAAFLGMICGGALISSTLVPCPLNIFCMYLVFLSSFHFSEYLLTAMYNPESLSTDSFLLNHSREYCIAAVTSWVEYFIEAYFFPSSKCCLLFNAIGILMVIFGELFRKGAMITAKSNFKHIVQSEKQNDHVLVTSGLYGWSRHPSYVGWFYWSIGTQVLLCNPICSVAYAAASWKFFNQRIEEEEFYLLEFFGDKYIDYVTKVPTRLPFINGLGKIIANDKNK